MSILFEKLPDKGKYEVYKERVWAVFLIEFIFPIAAAIFFFFFAGKTDLLIILILLILLAPAILFFLKEIEIINAMMKARFKNKHMKKEGGHILNFKNPPIIYIEK